MQYTVIFHSCKNGNFQMKNCDICFIFAQNIDRGYMLELNLCFRAKLKNVYHCTPQFDNIKVRCKGD